MKAIAIFIAGAVAMVVLLKVFSHSGTKETEKVALSKVENDIDKFVYKSDTARLIPFESDMLFNGIISFDENSVIKVFPFVSGTVEDVKVSLGSFVKKNEEIAKIKSGDISNIQNDYQVAEANYELAKKNLNVTEELYKSKFSSETELLTSRKEYEKAENQLRKAKSILSLYGTTQSSQPFYLVHSPIDGYIVEKNINSNMQLRSDNNTPMFVISDLKKVWVLANVYEADIAQVHQGQQVVITTTVYPDKQFIGKITNIGNVLDKESRVLKVRVELDNQEGLLKPDMFAAIRLHLNDAQKGLAIDSKAVVFDNDNYYAVVSRNGKFEIREVELSKTTSRHAYVSKGLKEGDAVVTEGSLLIYNELLSK